MLTIGIFLLGISFPVSDGYWWPRTIGIICIIIGVNHG